MLRDDIAQYTELSGNDGLHTPIGIIGAYLDGYEKGLADAQPEIVRCKDCKHSEHWYKDKSRCFLWAESGIDVYEDGFCNYAERRGYGV